MITPGLERVIQMGKARARNFMFGGGAVGRIPCPANSFLIIHHFDYWHFVDLPELENQPAQADVALVFDEFPPDPFDGFFDFSPIGFISVTIDTDDAAGTLADVN